MRSDPADDWDRDCQRPDAPAYVATTRLCVACRRYVPASRIAGERAGGCLCAACVATERAPRPAPLEMDDDLRARLARDSAALHDPMELAR